MRWLTSQNVESIAIVAAADTFPHASAIAMAKAAPDAGIRVTDEETVDKGTNDFGAILDRLKAGTPDKVVTILGPFTAGFFKAYEASGWKVPLTGRIDFLAALAAVSRQFTDSGSLSRMTSITVFTPEQQTAVLQSQNLQRGVGMVVVIECMAGRHSNRIASPRKVRRSPETKETKMQLRASGGSPYDV